MALRAGHGFHTLHTACMPGPDDSFFIYKAVVSVSDFVFSLFFFVLSFQIWCMVWDFDFLFFIDSLLLSF